MNVTVLVMLVAGAPLWIVAAFAIADDKYARRTLWMLIKLSLLPLAVLVVRWTP